GDAQPGGEIAGRRARSGLEDIHCPQRPRGRAHFRRHWKSVSGSGSSGSASSVIAMTDFRDQDLTGARFENVSLRRASRRIVDLSGAQLRSVMLHGTRMRGVELCDVDIYGELQHVVINGVDIAPLVEAELNRRMPDRAKCVPATA